MGPLGLLLTFSRTDEILFILFFSKNKKCESSSFFFFFFFVQQFEMSPRSQIP